jgi:hypothetical protein
MDGRQMTETVHRIRIEILVDQLLLPRIVAAAAQAGITAYTLFPAVGGAGEAGPWSDDQVSGASAKLLFAAVTRQEKADALRALLEPLLDDYGLVLMLSDVQVVRAEKF